MRVIFLTHNFPRFSGDVSGAFLASLGHGLRERGVDVRVIAPSDLGDVGAPELDGIPVRRVRYASPARERLAYRGTMAEEARTPMGAIAAWSLGRALRRTARQELAGGADLVHAHWWVPGGLASPPEARLVLTVHGTDAALLRRSGVLRSVARPLFRRAGVVTAVSRPAGDLIEAATQRRVDDRHIQPMPVDTTLYSRWSEGGGGIVVVARLTRQKRIHLALRAFERLTQQGRLLTIVGDGPERRLLESLSRDLGLEARVRFLGAQPPSRVAEVLSSADLAVFPAEREGFGLAAAEAFMAGVPVVACRDGGGVLSVVPASGAGRQVEPSATGIANGIDSLLADPGARAAARQAGAHWRTALSPASVAEICEGWYREALNV